MNKVILVSKIKPFQCLTGKEFNKMYYDIKFYKLTNANEKHNKFQYKTGLNIDTKQFVSMNHGAGIHFTDENNIDTWREYYLDGLMQKMTFKRQVLIPDDAQVFTNYYNNIKTDKIVLCDKEEL